MAYPGALQIDVTILFPGGDQNLPPQVSNACSEVDEVASQYTSVEWSVYDETNDSTLELSGVTFYTDSSKTRTFSPPYFGAGFSYGRLNWVIPFVDGASVPTEQDLTYVLHFKDSRYADLTWDPTLKVKPRAAGEAAGGAG